MSSSRNLTVEHALYGLALALGLGIRLLNLGRLPLSDFEANWALQALDLAQGRGPQVGANPAYVHLTALLFYLLPASNFLARLWPALTGASLILLPFFWRQRLGRLPALLLAFGLAFDPGLTALARLAGGPILALAAVLWGITFWRGGRIAPAGICAGLALLSGPAAWFGLVSLALVAGLKQIGPRPRPVETNQPESPARFDGRGVRTAALWGLGTLLLLGTLALLSPLGLSGVFGALLTFLRGWWAAPQILPHQILIALPAYAPLALIFGLAGLVRAILVRDEEMLRLGLWMLTALLLALVYPARQVADLMWMLVPLWALAAAELNRHFDFAAHSRWGLAGTMTLTFALLTSTWFYLTNAVNVNLPGQFGQARLLILLGLLLVLALTLVLVAYGWSLALARLGLVWGGGMFLFLLTIAALTDAAGLRQPRTAELWTPAPRIAQADLLLETIEELSAWNARDPRGLPVTVAGIESPALRWLLRAHPLEWTLAPPVNQAPPLLITAEVQPNLVAAYRGQDFIWRQSPGWLNALPGDWLRWYLFRQIAMQSETIILWARSDLLFEAPPAAP
ncbi:MAG: hypothetical protein ABWK53_03290 [Anaerolineales bacterium]